MKMAFSGIAFSPVAMVFFTGICLFLCCTLHPARGSTAVSARAILGSPDLNEDGLFGYCVQSCRDGFFYGHLPFSLLHAPPGQRKYRGFSTGHTWLSRSE